MTHLFEDTIFILRQHCKSSNFAQTLHELLDKVHELLDKLIFPCEKCNAYLFITLYRIDYISFQGIPCNQSLFGCQANGLECVMLQMLQDSQLCSLNPLILYLRDRGMVKLSYSNPPKFQAALWHIVWMFHYRVNVEKTLRFRHKFSIICKSSVERCFSSGWTPCWSLFLI